MHVKAYNLKVNQFKYSRRSYSRIQKYLIRLKQQIYYTDNTNTFFFLFFFFFYNKSYKSSKYTILYDNQVLYPVIWNDDI